MSKEELCLSNLGQTKAKYSKKEQMIKYNKARTRLLLLEDSECNRYIKNSKVRFNSELPREINRHYQESCTVSFCNPIVTNFTNKNVIQCIKRAESNIPNGIDDKLDLRNSSLNKSVNDFSKCLNDNGKEFIDVKKISVCYKKLEISKIFNLDPLQIENLKINSSNGSNNLCYTGHSLMHVINQINIKSSVSSVNNLDLHKRKFIFPGENRMRFEEMIPDKKKREAKRIKEKFNKLQNLANKLKNTGYISKTKLENNQTKNNRKLNGDKLDINKFEGLKSEPKIIKEIRKSEIDTKTFCTDNRREEREYTKQNLHEYPMQYFPSESERISDRILKKFPAKKSENIVTNPFRKADEKALNPNGIFIRKDVRNKPVSRTTNESGKLTAIILKIRENLFKTNQRYSIEQGKEIKNIPLNKTKTPFTNYNSKRNSTNTQSKQNFYETRNFQEEYEIDIKQFLDSSVGNLSDSDIPSRPSLCLNEKHDGFTLESCLDNYNNKSKKVGILSLVTGRDTAEFRNFHNSNLSKNSEKSRLSNSFTNSFSCSILSNDASNITPVSISNSEISD